MGFVPPKPPTPLLPRNLPPDQRERLRQDWERAMTRNSAYPPLRLTPEEDPVLERLSLGVLLAVLLVLAALLLRGGVLG